ncbi:hotdog fold thioesterase [Glutamicibacter endophyticus]
MADRQDSIWFSPEAAGRLATISGGLGEQLGIEITELKTQSIHGRMPVDERTIQPAGVLHGGASVAFAETLASLGGHLVVDSSIYQVMGQEINANHLRPGIRGEWVYGAASPVMIGRRSQVWSIEISNEQGKLICLSRCTLAVIEFPSRPLTASDTRAQ